MKLKLLLPVLLFTFFCARGQTLSGYVFDESTNSPLEGAYVYLDGTTFSANTDAKGYFIIKVPQKITAVLVVSYIGYEKMSIENPFQYTTAIKVQLREDTVLLNEIVIDKNPLFTRKQMLKAFRRQFLGTTSAGKSCRIENEDDIKLRYDETAHTLKAYAVKPLRIINKRLQYNLVFELADFEVNYAATTLADDYVLKSYLSGSVFFTDISIADTADKKRKQAYRGSIVHFMKAMATGNWAGEKFQLYVDRLPADNKSYFAVSDTLNLKKITYIGKRYKEVEYNGEKLKSDMLTYQKFVLLFDKKEQSFFKLQGGTFYIDENGLFFPLSEIFFGGEMAGRKVGDMLPADYVYTE